MADVPSKLRKGKAEFWTGNICMGAGGFDIDYFTSWSLKFTDKPKAYAAYGPDNEENDEPV